MGKPQKAGVEAQAELPSCHAPEQKNVKDGEQYDSTAQVGYRPIRATVAAADGVIREHVMEAIPTKEQLRASGIRRFYRELYF